MLQQQELPPPRPCLGGVTAPRSSEQKPLAREAAQEVISQQPPARGSALLLVTPSARLGESRGEERASHLVLPPERGLSGLCPAAAQRRGAARNRTDGPARWRSPLARSELEAAAF